MRCLQGLSSTQKRACDAFVYIPQYGAGTASLNVAVAASLVLHHFAVWAGYEERGREGEKFVVAPRPQRTAARGAQPPLRTCSKHERAKRTPGAACVPVREARPGGHCALSARSGPKDDLVCIDRIECMQAWCR